MLFFKSKTSGYRIRFFVLLLFLSIGHSVCNAHHNFGLHYGSSKIVTITGIVKRYAFINPHIEIELEVKQGANITQWKVETINARLAATYDLQKDSFKVGDPVEIKGWPAKDGSNTLGGHQLALPDGQVFVLRRSPNESPVKFRSIHGFLGEKRQPTPRETITNRTDSQNDFSIREADPLTPAQRNRSGTGGRGLGRQRGGGFIQSFPLTASLDRDGDGLISESEIEGAVAALEGLDQNQDGKLTRDELRPTLDTARGREGRRRNVPEQALQQSDDSGSEDPQIEFVEQMEEAGFAISALKELLEDERSTTELQLTEIENLQAALFNSKVLVQLIKISEDALGYHKGDELKARQGMKQSLLKVIDITLKIEANIINGKREAAFQDLKELLKLQRQKHKIYQ
tara:strand:+ start:122 stop:1324 length:1203 start_codon:yes stop_codon:yes gene_type:complete